MFDLVTLVFLHRYTRRPMHLFGFLGLVFGVLGSLIMAGFMVDWLLTGSLHVRPLMLGGVTSILVGLQLVAIGLLGEMINQRFARETPPPALSGETPAAPPRA